MCRVQLSTSGSLQCCDHASVFSCVCMFMCQVCMYVHIYVCGMLPGCYQRLQCAYIPDFFGCVHSASRRDLSTLSLLILIALQLPMSTVSGKIPTSPPCHKQHESTSFLTTQLSHIICRTPYAAVALIQTHQRY